MQVSLTNKTGLAGDAKIVQGDGGALPWRAFKGRHKDYDAPYWRRLRALYAGGSKLLRDPVVMEEIFVRNNREPDHLYELRKKTAYYLNYASEIIDHICGGLSADPIRIRQGDSDEVEDEFVHEFLEDTTPPGGDRQDFVELQRKIILEAFQVRTAWIKLDLPKAPSAEDLELMSQADQDAAGLRRVFCRVVESEQIINWQVDTENELEWVLTCKERRHRANFWEKEMVTATYTRWTREAFEVWEIVYPIDKEPSDEDMIPRIEGPTEHTFQRVPFIRFTLPFGLWAMDKLEAPARAHLNRSCVLDWNIRRALLPVLYEFLGPEAATKHRPIGSAQTNPNRAVMTPRSPSTVQRRGQDDSAEYVGPSAEPFLAALETLTDLRNEMHRILFQMALAVDFDSKSAVGRSGVSKREDKAATSVILKAVGKLLRRCAKAIIVTALVGRGDLENTEAKGASEWSATGGENFDAVEVSQLVTDLAELRNLDIPSPTAWVELFMQVLSRMLGGMKEDTLAKIRDELEQGLNPESMLMGGPVDMLVRQAVQETALAAATGQARGEPGDGEPPPAPPKKPPKKGPIVPMGGPRR